MTYLEDLEWNLYYWKKLTRREGLHNPDEEPALSGDSDAHDSRLKTIHTGTPRTPIE